MLGWDIQKVLESEMYLFVGKQMMLNVVLSIYVSKYLAIRMLVLMCLYEKCSKDWDYAIWGNV